NAHSPARRGQRQHGPAWRHGIGVRRLDFCRRHSPNVGSVRARARAVRSPGKHPAKETLMSYTPGRFVWFEHLSNDIPKARQFYEKLFGWNAETMPLSGTDPYVMIHNGEAGIGGYVQAPAGSPPQWMGYLSVTDVDSTYKAALAAGAKSLVAPMDYGSVGRAATLADPTGGVFSIWRGKQGDPVEVETTPPGGFI